MGALEPYIAVFDLEIIHIYGKWDGARWKVFKFLSASYLLHLNMGRKSETLKPYSVSIPYGGNLGNFDSSGWLRGRPALVTACQYIKKVRIFSLGSIYRRLLLVKYKIE